MYRGKFAFQNDWASLMVGRKFTVFALFYFVKLRVISYIWRGDLTEGLLRYLFGGLIFGGAHTWDGGGGTYFRNCTVCANRLNNSQQRWDLSANNVASVCTRLYI